MAKFPGKSRRLRPKTHHFLCCFGFSGKIDHFKVVKPGLDRKRKRFFSWFRLRNSPVAEKPVIEKTSEFYSTFPAYRHVSISGTLVATDESPEEDRTVATAIHRASEEKAEPVNVKQTIIESFEQSDSPKKPTGQTGTRFSDRFSSAKKNLEHTDPAHSLSFPNPNPNPNPTRIYGVGVPTAGETNGEMRKKYGPVAGMSMVVITLAIMLVWGRLCAILCTAAWFYIITSLRSSLEESRGLLRGGIYKYSKNE